ncbi:MAG: hypothetical protein H0X31_02090 [Nostocaceae cyanobacterium]|nr:hypothetical protein [Nostocaceae cyanobacterium]
MLASIVPSDALEASWLDTYEKQRNVIWQQLIELNCNIFLIEKIEAFPFNLFLPIYDDRIFWHLTKNALIEKSIMIISRVATDEGSLTIKHFRSEVLKHIRDDAVKDQLRATLKNIGFDTRMSKVENKVKHARNNYLAHLDPDLNINPDPQKIADFAISLNDIKDMLNIIVELFDALCFDTHHALWYWGYLDSRRDQQDTDIEKLLDSVAKESPLLNMPEQQSEFWEIQKENYLATELAMLNVFRRKFGLAEI